MQYLRYKPTLKRSKLRLLAIVIGSLLALAGTVASIYSRPTVSVTPKSVEINPSVSKPQLNEGVIDLINGQHWQMAGTTVIPGPQPDTSVLQVSNTDLTIVKQDGTVGQNNPPVNLYGTRLQTSGDFSISAKLSGISQTIGISLYGTPPLIEDELRAEEGTLDIRLNGDSLRISLSDQASNLPTSVQDIKVTANTSHTITITDHSGNLTFKFDNQAIGTTLGDRSIFRSGKIWLGIDARSAGSKFVVDQLTAQAENGGSIAAVDARSQSIIANSDGFAALAQKQRQGFLIGSAVALGPMVSDDQYRSLLGNYNIVTTENAGKFQTIHPLPGNQLQNYNFTEMDGIVTLADQAGLKVHGHTLVFGEANPLWLQEIAKNQPSQLEQIMVDHIKTVVGHYKGQVTSWDVVNEPLADYDTHPGQYGLRQNIWYNAIGPDYIAIALSAAHQADPNAKLWINEFGLEADDDRFADMLELVQRLKAQGIPLTGIGFQAHIDSNDTNNNDTHIDTNKLRSHMTTLKQLGFNVRISELDITHVSEYPAFADIIQSCLQESNCEGVTTWGVTDKYSSSGELSTSGAYATGIGLPWDMNLQPLPAVAVIKKALGGL